MKKFINKTDDFIIDSLKGFAKAHDDIVTLNLDPIFVTRKEINPNKVLLIQAVDRDMNRFTRVILVRECWMWLALVMCLPLLLQIK